MKTAQRKNGQDTSILLVIEPDAATRAGMKRLLEMNGYDVTAVADRHEASLVAERQNYDLILFDSDLPPPDSFNAGYQIHQIIQFNDTPLLIISVHEKLSVPVSSANADKFTVAYITNLTRFDEMEKLLNCLIEQL